MEKIICEEIEFVIGYLDLDYILWERYIIIYYGMVGAGAGAGVGARAEGEVES